MDEQGAVAAVDECGGKEEVPGNPAPKVKDGLNVWRDSNGRVNMLNTDDWQLKDEAAATPDKFCIGADGQLIEKGMDKYAEALTVLDDKPVKFTVPTPEQIKEALDEGRAIARELDSRWNRPKNKLSPERAAAMRELAALSGEQREAEAKLAAHAERKATPGDSGAKKNDAGKAPASSRKDAICLDVVRRRRLNKLRTALRIVDRESLLAIIELKGQGVDPAGHMAIQSLTAITVCRSALLAYRIELGGRLGLRTKVEREHEQDAKDEHVPLTEEYLRECVRVRRAVEDRMRQNGAD